MSNEKLLRCYNRGCGKEFREGDDSEDCSHHPGAPVFHDALKGWSCCKKRVTDFTEFLNIMGCTRSKHSNVKPPEPEPTNKDEKPLEKDEVIEVRKPMKKKEDMLPRPSDDIPKTKLKMTVTDSLRKALEKQKQQDKQEDNEVADNETDEVKPGTVCKNSSCNQTYENESSNDEKCWFHPGAPIFHEGFKFWTCCQKRTSDFSEFLNQEGCTPGSHRWKLTDEEKSKMVVCRYDWYQMGNSVVLSIYAKLPDPEQSVIEANNTLLSVKLIFGGANSFKLNLNLNGVIEPSKSSVLLSPTKVEVKLRKAELGAWNSLELKTETKG
ncbi:cysteine and histidine-rich domain-containing protein 1-like [Actinia tenebrosa]|uniref:Cysteine and histidine-rich domain-containing protein 1-like n=1 Tax=Actinia tenebrosa TaxID=6105 RepID=A0A6P8HHF9_ACTTE|nr:cysteine and histidine-rich domain-containing protein 1-like [Actinia tenebrosa]